MTIKLKTFRESTQESCDKLFDGLKVGRAPYAMEANDRISFETTKFLEIINATLTVVSENTKMQKRITGLIKKSDNDEAAIYNLKGVLANRESEIEGIKRKNKNLEEIYTNSRSSLSSHGSSTWESEKRSLVQEIHGIKEDKTKLQKALDEKTKELEHSLQEHKSFREKMQSEGDKTKRKHEAALQALKDEFAFDRKELEANISEKLAFYEHRVTLKEEMLKQQEIKHNRQDILRLLNMANLREENERLQARLNEIKERVAQAQQYVSEGFK